MSSNKINLLNSYAKLDELNDLQIINRRNMLKDITNLLQNNYLILKLSEKDDLSSLVDQKHAPSLLKYNLVKSLPVIDWSHTVLRGSKNMKSGFMIQGIFSNSPYFYLLNSNGDEVIFYLMRRMLNTTNYDDSNLLKPKYIEEICEVYKLGIFKNQNFKDIRSFVLYETILEDDFFENLINIFSESLVIYLKQYKKIENAIVNLYKSDIERKKQNKFEKFGIFKFLREFGYIFNREEKKEMILEARRILEIAEHALEEKEFYILKKRYFNNNVENFCELINLQKIGDEYSLTRERVRQIESSALLKMKSLLKTIDLSKNFNEDLNIFCKPVMPSYNSRKSELKTTISFLEEKYDIYFKGQLQMFGKTNLYNLLEEHGVSEFATRKFINYTFEDELINNEEGLLNKNIEVLKLSYRPKNTLVENGIFTVEQLVNFGIENLYKIKNLGRTSVEEVYKKLNNYLNEDDFFKSGSITHESNLVDADFSVRIINALNAVKIFTIEDLLNLEEEELQYIPNLGVTSIKEIKSKIKNLNFRFKG